MKLFQLAVIKAMSKASNVLRYIQNLLWHQKERMIKMDELEITKDLIRVLAFYGILKDWDMYELLDEYEHLGIPIVLVNETLREGVE